MKYNLMIHVNGISIYNNEIFKHYFDTYSNEFIIKEACNYIKLYGIEEALFKSSIENDKLYDYILTITSDFKEIKDVSLIKFTIIDIENLI